MAVLLILSSLAGERAAAEQADGNAGDNVVSGVEEQTIVVPFWDTKENMKYESTKGTIVYMDNPNVYVTVQPRLTCYAELGKLRMINCPILILF